MKANASAGNMSDQVPRQAVSEIAGQGLSLKGRALRALAARERSRAELERKLIGYEEAPGQLCQVLDDLQAKGFISEQRVAESVIHSRAAKLGAARIRRELQVKGLAPDLIAEMLATLKPTEVARARSIWQQRFGAVALDLRARSKQARFLAARGFGEDVIRRVLRGLDD